MNSKCIWKGTLEFPLKINLAKNKPNPGANILIAVPEIVWSAFKLIAAKAWSKLNRAPKIPATINAKINNNCGFIVGFADCIK